MIWYKYWKSAFKHKGLKKSWDITSDIIIMITIVIISIVANNIYILLATNFLALLILGLFLKRDKK